jgi:hypothetical protein
VQEPFFVKIAPRANNDMAALRDVIIGSLGLTGVIVLLALLSGCVFAGVLFWIRSRD